MFDTVARRYDVTNDVLSLGQDRRWRKKVLRLVDPQPGERVLDLAAGTGTSSVPFARAGATVVPCDFSFGMLTVGQQARPELPFVAGDGMRLPFGDETFAARLGIESEGMVGQGDIVAVRTGDDVLLMLGLSMSTILGDAPFDDGEYEQIVSAAVEKAFG